MSVTQEQRDKSASETMKHVQHVRRFILRFVEQIMVRSSEHDASKLEEPELSLFAEWGPKLSGFEYGSDEYKAALEKMGDALRHHYDSNRHHPEHHEHGVDAMNLIDLVEMVCDWKASAMRVKNGDFLGSLEHNRKRFNLSPQLVRIIANTNDLLDRELR